MNALCDAINAINALLVRWPMRAHARPMRRAAGAGPAPGQRKGAAQPPGRLAWGPHAAAWGRMPFHTRKRVGAARPMRAHARPMRRAAVASPLRANGKGHPSHPNASRMARMPRHGSTCQCRPRSGSAQWAMRAHARPMRRAAGVGPLRANGKGHPSRPDATHGAHMPLHGWSSRRHRRIG